MNFCEGYAKMLKGKKISAISWGSNAYVFIKNENLMLHWANGEEHPWHPTVEQLTEDNFVIVEGYLGTT